MSAPRDEALDALAGFWGREDDGGVWEPITFEVGDRVQIRPSPECRVVPNGGIAEYEDIEGHFPDEDGLIGEVREVLDGTHPLARQGHRFRVHYEELVQFRGWWCHGGTYAAAELLPLDATEQAGSARP